MTDRELLDNLRLADAILGEYKRIVMPAIEELAIRKQKGTGRKYDEGVSTLCTHHATRLLNALHQWFTYTT